jgi:hypothetical protein
VNIREKLEKAHSQAITQIIVDEICEAPNKMDELMTIFIEGPVQITQRASWPISVVAERHPELLNNYYNLFIELLNKSGKHDAINRNIVRALQFTEIPEEFQGELLDACFKLLKSSKEPIAVRAFCMTVIYNLSKKYPDIIPELRASIEAIIPNASTGLKNRGNKILKSINKI